MKKIGVLIPQSKAYPKLGKEFINGFKLLNISDASIVIEGIGFGENIQKICEKIDKLLLQDNINILVGLVGDYDLVQLYEKVNGLRVPSVFVRFGAFPNVKILDNQYAYSLSFGLSEGFCHLGKWLVENGMSKIATSGSYNDIGYGFIRYLEMGLYNAGGEFIGHRITPLKQQGNEVKLAQDFYDNLKYDAVCEFYNGEFANENVSYMEALNGKIIKPLFYTPFGLKPTHLQKVAEKVEELYMVAPWLGANYTGKVTSFDEIYIEKHNRYPGVFEWLGYNAAEIVRSISKERNELLNNKNLGDNSKIYNNTNLEIKFPMKIWKAEKSKGGKWIMKPKSSFDMNKEIPVSFKGQEKGWHNAYLCY